MNFRNIKKFSLKTLTVILVMVIATTALWGAAFADNQFEGTDVMQTERDLRYRETIECISRTKLWQFAPYSTIDNVVICNPNPGDSFNMLGYYTDVYGGTWWKVSIISVAGAPHLTGALGYISTSASRAVIG